VCGGSCLIIGGANGNNCISNTPGSSGTWHFQCDAITPVELSNFSASARNEMVMLDWKTESEWNNEYFSIQRSPDGVFFEEIGTVEGAGDSPYNAIHYQFIDESPLLGSNYYRLEQFDFDGISSFSSIRVQNVESFHTMSSTSSGVMIQYANEVINDQITILNISGQVVDTRLFTGNTFRYSTQLPAGIYIMKSTALSRAEIVVIY
jgi:hypothetical protein